MTEKVAKSIAHTLFVLTLLSRYATPSDNLIDIYEHWLFYLKDKT
jgi:hypothetical protein